MFLAHQEEVKFFELSMCCDDTNEITGNVFPCVVLSDLFLSVVNGYVMASNIFIASHG